MNTNSTNKRGYFFAALAGAIGGGLTVAIATKAFPKMMQAMMKNMMAAMAEGGCDPGEM